MQGFNNRFKSVCCSRHASDSALALFKTMFDGRAKIEKSYRILASYLLNYLTKSIAFAWLT